VDVADAVTAVYCMLFLAVKRMANFNRNRKRLAKGISRNNVDVKDVDGGANDDTARDV
jgi:hypothetical protein